MEIDFNNFWFVSLTANHCSPQLTISTDLCHSGLAIAQSLVISIPVRLLDVRRLYRNSSRLSTPQTILWPIVRHCIIWKEQRFRSKPGQWVTDDRLSGMRTRVGLHGHHRRTWKPLLTATNHCRPLSPTQLISRTNIKRLTLEWHKQSLSQWTLSY